MSDEGLRRTYQGMIERRGADRSLCPPAERLHELVTQSGSEDARLAVANHVMACPRCLPEFELLRSVNAAMPERKPVSRWLALAASVALLLATGIIGRQLLRGRDDVLREQPAIRLISPLEGQFSAPVTLTWNRVPDALQYQVQILTPDGGKAYQATTPDTTLVVSALAPGQFIWQISAEYATGVPLRSRPSRFTITTP
ncbi:MAG: hypothetical protein ABI836_09555 [Gemmatimonadota bacterium]